MFQFIPLILSLLPHIPDVIRTVELLHGPAPAQGPAKLQTAVSLILALLPDLEAAFSVSPALRAIIEKVVGVLVAVMNANGTMVVAAPAAIAPVVLPNVEPAQPGG